MAKTTKAINVSIGASLKELEQAMRDAGIMVEDFSKKAQKGGKDASGGFENLEKAAKNFKREQVQEGRLVGFYAKEIGGFVGASDAASQALGGITQGMIGLATATSPFLIIWAAFEVGSAVFGFLSGKMKETEENAKKAAEALGKIGDRLEEIRRKRGNITEVAVEADKLAAAQRIAAARAQAQAKVGQGTYDDVGGASVAARALNDLNEQIAEWEKVNGKLDSYISLQTRVVSGMREMETAVRNLAIAESQAKGNLDYEMAGGDGGVLQLNQKLDLATAKWKQMGAQAQVSIAQARGASEEEVARLKYKADLIGLTAQLSAATTSEEIKSVRARIAALGEELRLRELAAKHKLDPVVGPGNAQGETFFGQDQAQAARTQKQNEKDAEVYDQYNFGIGDISATEGKMASLRKGIEQTAAKWDAMGQAAYNAFAGIGNAIGGTAGQFVSQIGAMIAQVMALVVALAFSDTLSLGPAGLFAAVPTAAAILGTMIGMIAGISARADGGWIDAGRPYLVGERGPELVVPSASGTVIPNHQLGGGGGVAITFNAPVDATWWRQNERHIVRTLREASRSGRA